MTDATRWIGIETDPAETERWCFWLRLGPRTLYVWPWKVKFA